MAGRWWGVVGGAFAVVRLVSSACCGEATRCCRWVPLGRRTDDGAEDEFRPKTRGDDGDEEEKEEEEERGETGRKVGKKARAEFWVKRAVDDDSVWNRIA